MNPACPGRKLVEISVLEVQRVFVNRDVHSLEIRLDPRLPADCPFIRTDREIHCLDVNPIEKFNHSFIKDGSSLRGNQNKSWRTNLETDGDLQIRLFRVSFFTRPKGFDIPAIAFHILRGLLVQEHAEVPVSLSIVSPLSAGEVPEYQTRILNDQHAIIRSHSFSFAFH